MIPRTITPDAERVLGEYGKMLFLSGPRQVGKTTFAREALRRADQGVYFNWDLITDQKRLLKDPYFFAAENRDPERPFLVVLDEIHKYARWKQYLKGCYDRYHDEFQFLVTGSGRLDLFKRGGESLLGRYFAYPLLPLTIGEVLGRFPSWDDFRGSLHAPPAAAAEAADAYASLLRFSGFPEPFTRGEDRFYRAWFQERKSLLVREDIRSATNVREISLLELLSHLIPERVGSPLSINALREDIGVAFETARDWIELLDRFYYLFRVPPYTGRLARALRKETKAYLYDWVEVADEGCRFENLVALHLLKAAATWRARGDGDITLHYVRDREKREVDFLLAEKGRPVALVECQRSEETPSPALIRFQEALAVPTAVQLVDKPGVSRKMGRAGRLLWVLSADRWLASLP